jgi:Berberine and berberine like
LNSFVNYWFKYAKTNKRSWYVQIDLHGGSTSAVTTPAVDSTAYIHRDYLLMYSFYDRIDKGDFPADGFSSIQNFVANITGGMVKSDWGMYINYPDPKLDQNTSQVNYWGNHLPKLQAVKKAVDPTNVFHYPQGILPA